MLFRNKIFKSLALICVTVTVIIISVPKTYVHQWLGHNHECLVNTDADTQVAQQSNSDCEFEEYNTPVHFDITPSTFFNSTVVSHIPFQFNSYSYFHTDALLSITSLRGPPQA